MRTQTTMTMPRSKSRSKVSMRQQALGLARMSILAVAGVCALSAYGQATPARQSTRVDLAVTYAASHSIHTGSAADFWLQGGAVELSARFFHGLGIAASGTGLHVNSNNPLVAPLDLVTVTFGPRYTFFPHKRISVFGEALVGEALGFDSLFAYGSGNAVSQSNGTTTSADSLALQTGGGVDVRMGRRFAIRAIQVDYLRTQLPNGGSNLQNNLRLAAGIDLRFGR